MSRYPNGVRKKFKRPPSKERDTELFNLLRLMRGLKTTEIAKDAGLAHSTVSKLRCRTTRWPRWSTARAIAEACGYRMEFVPADDGDRDERRRNANEARVH
jgi:transcriptional regulator with XRE-family HTH domain